MTTRAAPWYRQRWPWLLIMGPAVVVVASLATFWLAASTDDGVIAEDYYKRGLLVNKELDRVAKAAELGLSGVLRVAPDGAATFDLEGVSGAATAPGSVRVVIVHPTRAGQDRTAVLTRGPGGTYVGTIAPAPQGRALVTVEGDGWRLPMATAGAGLAEVRLGAPRKAP
jgi:hypothetical protein